MNLVQIFSPFNPDNYEIWSDVKYKLAYELFSKLCEDRGHTFYYTPFATYNWGKKSFDYAYRYSRGEWTRESAVKADLVIDRTSVASVAPGLLHALDLDTPVTNNTDFTEVANDKAYLPLLFAEIVPPTRFVPQGVRLGDVACLSGDQLIFKPTSGFGGKGIEVIRNDPDYVAPVNGVIQEFIDSRAGIPGICTGYHDLRLTYIGTTLQYAYVRQPAQGSLLANIAQGGSMYLVDAAKLPPSTWDLARVVQTKLVGFPKALYTIDLFFDLSGKPWLIELNSKPGMYFPPEFLAEQEQFYLSLIAHYTSLIRQ